MTPEQTITKLRLVAARIRELEAGQLDKLKRGKVVAEGPPDCTEEELAVEAAEDAGELINDVIAAAQEALIECQNPA